MDGADRARRRRTMTTERATAKRRLQQTSEFVERALRDFGLWEDFESRSGKEREACLQWIDAAVGERAQEDRVSEMLDCLAFGQALPSLG